jgi:uncharacterized protein YjiS (DUF1127 family)
MTLIAVEGPEILGPNVKFASRLASARHCLLERYRRWRRYRRTATELRQYTDSELVELGISSYDIEAVAQGAYSPGPDEPILHSRTP